MPPSTVLKTNNFHATHLQVHWIFFKKPTWDVASTEIRTQYLPTSLTAIYNYVSAFAPSSTPWRFSCCCDHHEHTCLRSSRAHLPAMQLVSTTGVYHNTIAKVRLKPSREDYAFSQITALQGRYHMPAKFMATSQHIDQHLQGVFWNYVVKVEQPRHRSYTVCSAFVLTGQLGGASNKRERLVSSQGYWWSFYIYILHKICIISIYLSFCLSISIYKLLLL